MQCKWCVIRVVVNDVKYYCFRGENLKGLDNNHTQNSFFAFSYQHFNIFGTSPDRFWILHLVVKSFTHQLFDFMGLTLWNMVWKKIINGYYSNTFYFAMTNKTKQVSQNIYPQSTNLYFSYFSYQISQTDAQPFFLNWLQSSLDILGTDESKNRTFPN